MTELFIIAIFILLLMGCAASIFIKKAEYIGKVITLLNLGALVFSLILLYQLNSKIAHPTYWFNLYIDTLGSFITVLILILSTTAAYFSIPVIKGELQRVQKYYFWYSLFIFAMIGTVMSADILSTYLYIEGATIFSVLLVAHENTSEAFEASLKYLIICSFGTAMIIIALTYMVTLNITSFSYNDIYSFLQANKNTITNVMAIKIIFLSVFFGFGAKAGIIPFYTWLPDAYSEAPAPISAILGGIMTETAAIALIRTFDAFSPILTQDLYLIVIVIGTATMILGALFALVQTDIKRLLSYSCIDEIGYIILGIGIATQIGLYGSVFDIFNHGLLKSTLFLISGALLFATGTRDMKKMGGLVKKMPLLATTFLVAGLSMGGVPPLNGFYSKFLIYDASFKAGYTWVTILAIVASLIAVGYFVRAAHMIFFGEPKVIANGDDIKTLPKEMTIPIAILLLLIAVASAFPEIFLTIVVEAVSGLNSF